VAERIAVIGAAGFAGALAARLVDRHPRYELAAVTARGEDVGQLLSDLYPHYRVDLPLEELDVDRLDVDAAIVAYPHGASAPVVAALRERGVRVLDLSADFRLRDRDTYAQWYGEHGAPALFGSAVYGLPELYREQIEGAELVAGPGCYPTAAILALRPLAARGLIADVVIDAKSGVSGAGRAATRSTHFVTVDENVSPYKIEGHRHAPEIEQEVGVQVTFVPHLVPLDQGELVSCYVTPAELVDPVPLYAEDYAGEPFVELTDRAPGVRDVRETNLCRIHARADERTGKLLVFAAIDNLWKGTSSQAIQSLNLMLGRPEAEGIEA
jgi:N-acetyl-gamma-glutamyl-phosphate reductase